MRILTLFAALCLISGTASAQLLAVYFKDPKDANKFKNNLVLFKGNYVVVGEALMNVSVDLTTNTITKVPSKPLEFLVPDPDDPSKVPYKFEDDKKVITIKKQVLSIPEQQVDHIDILMRDNNLLGLAQDYATRQKEIDDLFAQRDSKGKGSPEWMRAHQQATSRMERLVSWLETTCYPGAAKKAEKELVKQQKVVIAEAIAARGIAAKASLTTAPVPEDLLRIAKEISGGTDVFKVQESLHCRIIYRSGIDDGRVKELLYFAEEVVEGFRLEFVDPYLDAAFEDYIPENKFAEWWFGPDVIERHARYLEVYYKYSWGDKKEERLKMSGHPVQRGTSPNYLHYWKTNDESDLEGMMAHDLGHDLANMHFDKKRLSMSQDWLAEAVGFYVSLDWLGRNTVTCKQFETPGVYAHQKKKEGDKTLQTGLRDYYNTLALEGGSPIDKLALKTLFEMADADLAKSWSFFDFIAKKGGKEGQLFLRAACNSARTPSSFIKDWRAKSEEIFDIHGQDVFAAIDKRWKEFAEVGQDTGDTKRK